MTDQLVRMLSSAKVYDLSQPHAIGMPHYPTHPPYLYSLTKQHGDYVEPGEVSFAADAIALGTHTGTHIDALSHCSCGGQWFGKQAVQQEYTTGMGRLGVETVAPMLRRGVLLDVAGALGHDVLPPDFAISPEHLDQTAGRQQVDVRQGDVVLLRTGWARHWDDPRQYLTGGGKEVRGPGPERPAAEWLSSRQIFAAGSDTVAFERAPSKSMPVHVHLLVERGIHIIEVLNLEQLASERVYEFLFVAIPLAIRGATGSPLRPLAVLPNG